MVARRLVGVLLVSLPSLLCRAGDSCAASSILHPSRHFFSAAMAEKPIIIPATEKHSATVIFLHGLGDTGDGWAPVFQQAIREPHIKYICPTAPVRPVTINMGMRMPAWFDIFGLTADSKEDEQGARDGAKILHALVEEEVRAGVPSERVLVGGFSMGGALALYSAFTYDRPLAGVVALSAFLVGRNDIPGVRRCGGAAPSRSSLQNHQANRQMAIFQGHGEADPMVALSLAEATAKTIQAFNPNLKFQSYPGMGHSSCDQELQHVKQFIAQRLPRI